MNREKIGLQTEVVSSDDLKNTYSITRTWDDKAKKLLVLELYPTLNTENLLECDLSTMHLMNHICELGNYGTVKIMNLYSNINKAGKPLVAKLNRNEENMTLIEEAIETAKKEKQDVLIAWGSTLKLHRATLEIKRDVLSMLSERRMKEHVFHIVVNHPDAEGQIGVHPLFLGLRCSKETWELERFPIERVLYELNRNKKQDEVVEEKNKKKSRKTKIVEVSCKEGKDVLQDHGDDRCEDIDANVAKG